MVDITLINPKMNEPMEPSIFMSLLYLATSLEKNGFSVKVVDSQIENVDIEKIVKTSESVGLSVMTAQIRDALRISDAVKSKDPNMPIIWGGIHPTLFPSQTVSDKSVDYVIVEEAENGIVDIVKYIKGEKKLKDVSGLAYKYKGKFRINRSKPVMVLDNLSPPSWHLFKMEKYVTNYLMGGKNYGPHLQIHSGRGCPYNCTFCINTYLSVRKWRPLSARKIVNEVKILKKKFGIKFVTFVDENFFLDKKRLEEFCKLMIKENVGIEWRGNSRANYFNENHLNRNLLELVRKSGCRVISMGFESGSGRVLKDVIKKEITVEQIINSVKACKEFGIIPIGSFMAAIPGERKGEWEETLSLIRKLKKTNPQTIIIGPQIFRPYPGAPLYDSIKHMIREPNSLRAWAKMDTTVGGYMDDASIPWIEDPKKLVNALYYMTLTESTTSGIAMLLKLPFKLLAEMRVSNRFYSFPIEKQMYTEGKNLFYHIKNIMRRNNGD